MPTSGSYSYSISRDRIITMAMLYTGKLGEGEIPTPQEMADCSDFLNMMVKQWMARQDFAPGLKTWTRKHAHLFLSSTTGQYSVGQTGDNWTLNYVSPTLTAAANAGATAVQVSSATGISANDYIGIQVSSGDLFWTTVSGAPVGLTVNLASAIPNGVNAGIGAQVFDYTTKATRPEIIESVSLRDINNNDIPINMLTEQDYALLPAKTNPQSISDPTAIYYEEQLNNGIVYTDVPGAQDVTKHLVIDYMEPVQDFVNPLDNPYYPQQWYMALVQGLAKIVAPMFNAPWSEDQETNLGNALAMARMAYPERTSLYYQPGNE